jgi:hypothetical protein
LFSFFFLQDFLIQNGDFFLFFKAHFHKGRNFNIQDNIFQARKKELMDDQRDTLSSTSFKFDYKGSNARRYDFGDVLTTCIILNVSQGLFFVLINIRDNYILGIWLLFLLGLFWPKINFWVCFRY